MKRLERGAAPTTVKIDYSFNEASYELQALSLDGEETIQAYGLTDLLAEKLRSIIQQVVRKRNRRQDVYDIWYLLDTSPPLTHREKQQVLDTLDSLLVFLTPQRFPYPKPPTGKFYM